jgi:hypothetical protein
MTPKHLLYRAGLVCLAYFLLAFCVFVATFFSDIPLEVSAALVFPLYLPFGTDFVVQIVRTSFASEAYVFLFYLVLEWLVATFLLFGVMWFRANSPRQPRE